MTRFLNIYTIDKFNFLPSGSSELSLVATGETRQVNGVTCDTYKMDVRIPGDYPLGLYPIRIRMASTTLNPFKAERRSSGSSTVEATEASIAVEMGGTENGDRLDGETLAGMSYSSTFTDWNYRAVGDPWNFWFIDSILNKPSTEEDGVSVEDTTDKIYTIYFDDVRPLRATGNQAYNLGLFLKIKYFGPAVAVTP